MNKKSFYFGTLVLAALALGSCANEDTATDKTAGKDTPKTGTVFSSETEPATRTSATYTGSGLDFYWTASDKIWVKDDNGTYRQNSDDDIATRIAAVPGSTTTDKAKFWVNGSYTGSTHKVRYTGKSGVKDKVTIKASQTQNTPNDAAHIAEDGDFGVADATGSGAYSFTLNHKAAYVTFMPYTAQGVIAGAKLQKIRIYTDNSSDQLAGTFDLADNGTLSNGVTTSNSVELNVSDFSIPNISTYATNGATMVVRPGTYNNLTIEYTLHDAVTGITGTVEKTYHSVTFDAGKNTPVKADLQVPVYPGDNYYQWDAQKPFWYGYEWTANNPAWQPTLNGGSSTFYPQSKATAPDRWYNDTNYGLGVRNDAQTDLFKNLPNANELAWYAEKGDPRWDNNKLWATMGHLYKGGMWFLKKQEIANKNTITIALMENVAPDKVTDLRLINHRLIYTPTSQTAPSASERSKYFYLPALGYYLYDKLYNVGNVALYFSSSATPEHSNVMVYGIIFSSTYIHVDGTVGRDDGAIPMKFE